MIRSSIGRRTSDGSIAAAALELISGTNKGSWLREMTISLAAATASVYGLGRPAVTGITPTTPVSSLLRDAGAAVPSFTTAIAWGTGPTVPAQFFRRIGFPATIGSTISWELNIFIPSGETLVLWNIAENGIVDVTLVTEEQQ